MLLNTVKFKCRKKLRAKNKGETKMSIMITDKDFESEVLSSEIPVIVDFFAKWCGPCRMLTPIIDEIADEKAGVLKVCKVDVDSDGGRELAKRFSVMSIPTLLIVKGGEVVARSTGFRPKSEILALLD